MQSSVFKAKQIKRATVILAVIVAILLVYNFIQLQKFHIVNTDPSTSRFSNLIPFMKINFNKPVSRQGLYVSSSPNIINSYTVNNKTLSLSLKPLTLDKSYVVTLRSVYSTNGQKIINDTIRFTTTYINPNNLPTDQQQAILRNQDHYSSPLNNPIVQYLPHQTLNYELSAAVSNNQLVLNAQITLNEANMSNEALAVASYKQQIASYIQSLGLNPNSYTIRYSVQTP